MDHEEMPIDENTDAMLVSPEILAAAVGAAVDATSGEDFIFVRTEPLLSSYCRNEMFQILGKLSVSGASPKVVRGVAVEIHRIITVTSQAMKISYCALLEDFLPEFVASEPEPTAETENEE